MLRMIKVVDFWHTDISTEFSSAQFTYLTVFQEKNRVKVESIVSPWYIFSNQYSCHWLVVRKWINNLYNGCIDLYRELIQVSHSESRVMTTSHKNSYLMISFTSVSSKQSSEIITDINILFRTSAIFTSLQWPLELSLILLILA